MNAPTVNIESLQLGIFNDIPADVYHDDRSAVSKHWLDLLNRSPGHLRYYLDQGEFKRTEAFIFGELLHTHLLEPDLVAEKFAVLPADRPNRPSIRQRNAKKPSDSTIKAIEFWDQWNAENGDKTIVETEQMKTAEAMAMAVRNYNKARKILDNGKAEVTNVWKDHDTGEKCKARADWIHADCLLVDVKTSTDARPDKFARDLINYRYDVQSGHYTDGFEIDKFLFFVIEKEPPYGVSLFVADHEIIQRGKTIRDHNLIQYAECRLKNEWPCYPDEVQTLKLPPWARRIDND